VIGKLSGGAIRAIGGRKDSYLSDQRGTSHGIGGNFFMSVFP